MERLKIDMTSHIRLLHGGGELRASAPAKWATMSFVNAVMSPDAIPLTIGNASSHALVASTVVRMEPSSQPKVDSHHGGLTLRIRDDGAPLANGCSGVVFEGSVDDGAKSRKVAVKKFFMLLSPRLYSLTSAAQVQQWVEQEVLPEVNMLAALSHPNIIRLRCVGLDVVCGAKVPAYIAMDLCSSGTLEHWIKNNKICDYLLVEFLCDLIEAMLYLHSDKNLVHRDIKPDNIFVHENERRERPYLVLGDIGLAKHLNRSVSLVSAQGAAAYRAPEACTDAAKCSKASDMFSMALVAVELATKKCVHTTCGGDQADVALLTTAAKSKIRSALEFADDSWLTPAAADLMLGNCTIRNPKRRSGFDAIVDLCPRHERTARKLQLEKEAEREAALAGAVQVTVLRAELAEKQVEEMNLRADELRSAVREADKRADAADQRASAAEKRANDAQLQAEMLLQHSTSPVQRTKSPKPPSPARIQAEAEARVQALVTCASSRLMLYVSKRYSSLSLWSSVSPVTIALCIVSQWTRTPVTHAITVLALDSNPVGGCNSLYSAHSTVCNCNTCNQNVVACSTGRIPTEIGNLTTLTELRLQYNQLTG